MKFKTFLTESIANDYVWIMFTDTDTIEPHATEEGLVEAALLAISGEFDDDGVLRASKKVKTLKQLNGFISKYRIDTNDYQFGKFKLRK